MRLVIREPSEMEMQLMNEKTFGRYYKQVKRDQIYSVCHQLLGTSTGFERNISQRFESFSFYDYYRFQCEKQLLLRKSW